MKQNSTAAAQPVRKNKLKNRDRQIRSLFIAGGLLLWSAAGHCTAYRVLGPAAQGEPIQILRVIAPGFLLLSGAALLLAAVFAIRPVRPWKRCRKRLCYLGAGYLGVQLLLSVAAGAFAWCLGYFAGLSEEHVKTGADLFCGILQILAGFRNIPRAVYVRTSAACALCTLCRYLLTLWQGGIIVLIIRVVLSAAMTGGLWGYVYRTCQKEAAPNAADPTDSIKQQKQRKKTGGYER